MLNKYGRPIYSMVFYFYFGWFIVSPGAQIRIIVVVMLFSPLFFFHIFYAIYTLKRHRISLSKSASLFFYTPRKFFIFLLFSHFAWIIISLARWYKGKIANWMLLSRFIYFPFFLKTHFPSHHQVELTHSNWPNTLKYSALQFLIFNQYQYNL